MRGFGDICHFSESPVAPLAAGVEGRAGGRGGGSSAAGEEGQTDSGMLVQESCYGNAPLAAPVGYWTCFFPSFYGVVFAKGGLKI